jgi:hypothetical protein
VVYHPSDKGVARVGHPACINILNAMTRLFASALLAVVLPIPVSGTLVVIVPTADGLIVAADSRTSLLGTTCDGQYKITELRRPKRTVIAVTGEVAFIAPPGAEVQDMCGYLKSAPHMLDFSSAIKSYLERKNVDPFKLSLDELGAECVKEVERFRRIYPLVFEQYIGNEIFSVVIASYDPRSKNSLVLNFVIRIDAATRKVEAARFTRNLISQQSRRGVWSYGETDYLNKNVFGGIGRGFLTSDTRSFILVDKPVSEARLEQAIAAATNIIDATSLTTQIIPSPSGIGGPVDIVLLGKKRRPEQIRWKSNQ